MTKYKITNSDIDTLKRFNSIFTKDIKQSLPSDCGFSDDYISSEINYQFYGYLYSHYNCIGSFTAYCYRWGKIRALDALWKEYKEVVRNVEMIEADEEDEEGNIHHQTGKYKIEPYTQITKHLEDKDDIQIALYKMNKLDRMIAKDITTGKSLDEIAKDYGFKSRSAILKRMRKYA